MQFTAYSNFISQNGIRKHLGLWRVTQQNEQMILQTRLTPIGIISNCVYIRMHLFSPSLTETAKYIIVYIKYKLISTCKIGMFGWDLENLWAKPIRDRDSSTSPDLTDDSKSCGSSSTCNRSECLLRATLLACLSLSREEHLRNKASQSDVKFGKRDIRESRPASVFWN